MDRDLFIVSALCAGIIVLTIVLGAYSCKWKWEKSGMATDWGLVQGCLVKVGEGRWVPAERYRELE